MKGLSKAIGGLLGFLLLGPVGCLAGIIIGHIFDQLGALANQGSHRWHGSLTGMGQGSSDIGSADLPAAYRLLQLSESATSLEVKNSYRRLMGRYHPDRLAKQLVSSEDYHTATSQAKRIKEAYDLICQSRNLQ